MVTLLLATQPREAEQPVPSRQSEAYRLTPERRALLHTIRFGEGTWLGGRREGYRILYSGGCFDGFARHPDEVVRRRYVSAAAGPNQFLPQPWGAAARDLGLPDVAPPSQDQAALHLMEKRGALTTFDREGLTPAGITRLAPEWASLPTLGGTSAYAQPVRTPAELQGSRQRKLRTG
jgi:lysozyme